MTDDRRDSLDRLLRETLERSAERYQPGADGLMRIRERISRRRTYRRWLVPAACLAAAAAVVGPAVLVPAMLGQSAHQGPGRDGRAPVAGPVSPNPVSPSPVSPSAAGSVSPTPAAPTPSSSVRTSANPSVSPSATGSPGGQLPDLPTVWPYATRHLAAAGEPGLLASKPYLCDPARTAQHFLSDYLGITGPLSVTHTGPLGAGIAVTLGRANPAGQLSTVTTVYLVRVASGREEPYVVVRADAPGLKLAADPLGPGRVSGGITGVDESILVRLLTAGTGRQVASGRTQAGGQDAAWQAPVDYHRASAGSYAVVAQTDSAADGGIARITVAPVRI